MTSTSPLGAEALQKRFQGAHPNPEDIGPAAADHIAHNLAAMAGATNDLLDRHACISGMPDRRVFGLTTKKSLVLAPLGAGKENGINRSSGERPADRAHALPHRLKEGGAGVFYQMPTVRDLCCLGARTRDSMPIPGSPIAGDNVDARMARQHAGGRDADCVGKRKA
jgi:hypothetical protein